MDVIKATVKDRRLEVQVPPTWPDGTEVIVRPIGDDVEPGIRDADWLLTADAVTEWETWYDSLEPLIFTPDERAAWAAAQQERKRSEKATFVEQADKLGKVWK